MAGNVLVVLALVLMAWLRVGLEELLESRELLDLFSPEQIT